MVTQSKISVTNSTPKPLLLILEPWAEEFSIAPGTSVDVLGSGGSGGGFFEVEYIENGLIVYGWAGSIVSVMKNGVPIPPEWL